MGERRQCWKPPGFRLRAGMTNNLEMFGTREQARAFVQSEIAKWTKIIKEANIKVQ